MMRAGTDIGRYRIESPLGAGGMGEVYAAHDTQLGRGVALKILRDAHATSDRVERFSREAHAASSLNHPAIVAVYDSGEAVVDGESVHFLAMERVEGETLRVWSARRHDRAKRLELLAQIADGLARAHAAGIVHRDLKPDNVMVARGGYPKIVDFGIAKLLDGRAESSSETAPDALLGTTAYMSPEQAEGREVDHRTDVFAFGSMAAEVLTGKAPFRRATRVETLHAVVHDAPRVDELEPSLRRIVLRCLARDPEERYQSLRDVALDLREVAREGRAASGSRPRRVVVSLLAVLGAVALLGWWLNTRGQSASAAVPPPMRMTRATNSGKVLDGAISPDGRYVVYAAEAGGLNSLWVRQLATDRAMQILAPIPAYIHTCRVSPDGNYVFYIMATRDEPNVNDVWVVPILGGDSRKVASDIEGGLSLHPDGRQISFRRFNASDRVHRLFIADIESGSERVVHERRYPGDIGSTAWTPDGNSLLFVTGRQTGRTPKLIAELEVATGRLTTWNTPQWRSVGSICPLPDGSGMLVNVYDWQQPPQVWLLPRDGAMARKITSDLAFYGSLTITADGRTIAAQRGEKSAQLWLTRIDDPDQVLLAGGLGEGFGIGGVRWLPDGRVVSTSFAERLASLVVIDPADGVPRPLSRGYSAWAPEVSPDGKRLAFLTDRVDAVEIWTSALDGSDPRPVTRGGRSISPSFFPDGKTMAYVSIDFVQAAWTIPVAGGKPTRLTEMPANSLAVSPDGRSMLCRLRSMRREPNTPLWRTALVPLDGKGEPSYFPVPRYGGGPYMRWLPDGRSFLYLDWKDGAGNLWLQPLAGGEARQVTHFDSGFLFAFDVAKDGRSLVISRGEVSTDIALISDFR